DELAEDMVEHVQAVTEGDRQQVRTGYLVEHVGVGLDHDVARNRKPDHRRRQDLSDVPVPQQFLDELDRWRLASLQPDGGAHALLYGKRGHVPRLADVATERPLAIDHLAGGKGGFDQLLVM